MQPLLEDVRDQLAGKKSLTKHVIDINAANSVRNRMFIDTPISRPTRPLVAGCHRNVPAGNEPQQSGREIICCGQLLWCW
jgi:hypothetical protein